jgi:hypothetical protein
MSAEGARFGKDRLLLALEETRAAPLTDTVAALLGSVYRWCGTGRVRDDMSILALEFTGRPLRGRRPSGRSVALPAQPPRL